MKMGTWLTLGAVVIVVLAGLWKLLASSNWVPVEGLILASEIRIERNMSRDKGNEYIIDMEYEYNYHGQIYTGSKVFPSIPFIPNTFSRSTDAEEVFEKYPVGKVATIYVDPDDPGNASLIVLGPVSSKARFALVSFVLVVLSIVGAGIWYFERR